MKKTIACLVLMLTALFAEEATVVKMETLDNYKRFSVEGFSGTSAKDGNFIAGTAVLYRINDTVSLEANFCNLTGKYATLEAWEARIMALRVRFYITDWFYLGTGYAQQTYFNDGGKLTGDLIFDSNRNYYNSFLGFEWGFEKNWSVFVEMSHLDALAKTFDYSYLGVAYRF